MFFSSQTKTPAPKPAPRVIATAWPAQYKDDEAYFRCRLWDSKADTEPFYMWAPRRLLSADPRVIIETLAAAKPEAFDILERAMNIREEVEFNQDVVDPAVLEAALRMEGVTATTLN